MNFIYKPSINHEPTIRDFKFYRKLRLSKLEFGQFLQSIPV